MSAATIAAAGMIMQANQVHFAATGDQVTACGRIVTRVKTTGQRRRVTCPTCLRHR